MSAVLFTTDLALSSKFSAASARTGIEARTVMSLAALVEQAAGAALVVLDLSAPKLDLATVVSQLKALSPTPRQIIAFGPHVQEALLSAAAEAGCDIVLTRGQFHSQMDALLTSGSTRL